MGPAAPPSGNQADGRGWSTGRTSFGRRHDAVTGWVRRRLPQEIKRIGRGWSTGRRSFGRRHGAVTGWVRRRLRQEIERIGQGWSTGGEILRSAAGCRYGDGSGGDSPRKSSRSVGNRAGDWCCGEEKKARGELPPSPGPRRTRTAGEERVGILGCSAPRALHLSRGWARERHRVRQKTQVSVPSPSASPTMNRSAMRSTASMSSGSSNASVAAVTLAPGSVLTLTVACITLSSAG